MHHHNSVITHRKRWALGQRELANLLGTSRQALQKYESAERSPGELSTMLGLELAFGKPLAELFPRTYQAVARRMVENASDLSSRIEHHTGPVAERKREFLAVLAEWLHNALGA